MVKMTKSLDLEMHQTTKLNEYLLVVDRIRKARHNARQGNSKLCRKLLNFNDGSGAPPFSTSKSFRSTDLANNSDGQSLHGFQAQFGSSPPISGNSVPKTSAQRSQVLTCSIDPGKQMGCLPLKEFAEMKRPKNNGDLVIARFQQQPTSLAPPLPHSEEGQDWSTSWIKLTVIRYLLEKPLFLFAL
jgi:hypothetical protein